MPAITMRAESLVAILFVAAMSGTADAAIVLLQPPATTLANGLRSNFPGVEFHLQVADDFEISNDTLITQIEWAGAYIGDSQIEETPSVKFTLRFYDSSLPKSPFSDQVIVATHTPIGADEQEGATVYEFNASLTQPLVLLGNVTYWASIMDSDTETVADFVWLESSDTSDPKVAFREVEGNFWFSPNFTPNRALTLYGVVPEPSAFAIAATSLFALSVIRRRR
jgi:hypothetical protein